ncbi:MAG: hypothetical protein MUF04_00680, partial [Akkermansiaceae bacterium]|nr:hypothetical protein [Akkermansiaceae bacterium]
MDKPVPFAGIRATVLAIAFTITATTVAPAGDAHSAPVREARHSAVIAGNTLGKVQRWLREAALPKIDPKTNLYISSDKGSARYPKARWNYDDTAADTY